MVCGASPSPAGVPVLGSNKGRRRENGRHPAALQKRTCGYFSVHIMKSTFTLYMGVYVFLYKSEKIFARAACGVRSGPSTALVSTIILRRFHICQLSRFDVKIIHDPRYLTMHFMQRVKFINAVVYLWESEENTY